ncbi:MAG: hydantoinase B/oxoprolinase family protein, partial [Actinomycetota bacterium]|nr:hydantoinase B/oxoprolinase family protein [Actinomycetota bacterium]
PTIPINDGARRVLSFVSPEGRLTNARFPAPVNNYYGVTHVLYSCVLQALAKFQPERAVGAAGFGVGAVSFGYRQARAGKPAVQYEILVTSLGATPTSDGTFVVMAMSHITPNTPIEILETEFPVLIETFEPTADTGGAGYHRGGVGYRKEYRALGDAQLTLRLGQFRHGAWGVLGGKPPSRAKATLNPGTDRETPTATLYTAELHQGDTVRLDMPGGGGYGDPLTREPERVLDDVLDGYVSVEAAERDYGVVIDLANKRVDEEQTAALRARMRR